MHDAALSAICDAMSDETYMLHALRLAERGLGLTSPNPTVGCVLVKNGAIIARGWTQPGGRPHAEAEALARAGEEARGATAYVTLEPCAHHGQTPPCAEALIAAGISRVVVACADPDSRTAGQGIAKLKAAGIAITENILKAEAAALNAGFFRRLATGRPWVSLKVATTADGFVANGAGQSQWITGPRARAEGHRLRAQHDAIVTGIGTVFADDPALTCRLPGMENRSPIRVVLDRSLRLPLESRLVQSAREVPVWAVTTEKASETRAAALTENGVRVLRLPMCEPTASLALLGTEGITRVLIEAGPRLSTAFLPHIDRLYWFRAPLIVGAGGLSAFGQQEGSLTEQPRRRLIESRVLGADRLEIYDR